MEQKKNLAEILVIEDNEGDIELIREAFSRASLRHNLNVVMDGDQALHYLFKRNEYKGAVTPDIILLDLNLPKTDGRGVLEKIKGDPALRRIPTIMLTSSQADQDVADCYDLHANCYIVKPMNAVDFMGIVQKIESFWANTAFLPFD